MKPYDARTLRYVARSLGAEAQRPMGSHPTDWLQGYRSAESQHAVNFRNLALAIERKAKKKGGGR